MPRVYWLLVPSIFGLAASLFVAAAPQDQDEDEAGPSTSGKVEVARLMKTCKKCHLDQWAEWEKSRHGKSWSNPVLQAAIVDLPDKGESCARCHAPDSLLVKGIGALPDARETDRDYGVNCTTCHNSPARYHGPYASEGHGGVVVEETYLQSRVCESCHGHPDVNAAHDQFSSYLESVASKDGKSCQSCHMQDVERKMARGRRKLKNLQDARVCRTHVFEAALTTGKADDAAAVTLADVDGRLAVTVTPKTGHAFPASEGRDVGLSLEFLDDQGEVLSQRREVFTYKKRELRPESPTTLTYPWPAAARRARVALTLDFPQLPGRPESTSLPIVSAELAR